MARPRLAGGPRWEIDGCDACGVPALLKTEDVVREISDPLAPRERSGSYKFSLKRMVQLVNALVERQALSSKDALQVMDLSKESGLANYRDFLVSGGFVEAMPTGLRAGEALFELWNALEGMRTEAVERLLRRVSSVRVFFDHVKMQRRVRESDDLPVPQRAFATYAVLTEVSAVGLSIPDEGLYATDATPSPQQFASFALQVYDSLARGEDFVSTGAWLEALARDHSVHPISSRTLLEEAWRAGLLERYVEGSTPDTRYEKHSFWALTGRKGAPDVQQVKLYHGDFLMPERASVSLRLVKKGAS